jgi:hypothetical protein
MHGNMGNLGGQQRAGNTNIINVSGIMSDVQNMLSQIQVQNPGI